MKIVKFLSAADKAIIDVMMVKVQFSANKLVEKLLFDEVEVVFVMEKRFELKAVKESSMATLSLILK